MYTRNLKSSVTLFELEEIFSNFGQTASCVIKSPSDPTIKTKYAFIDFKDKDAALKCLQQGRLSNALQHLYENKDVYLNMFLKRQHFESYKTSQSNWRFEKFKSKFDPQMFQYFQYFFQVYQSTIIMKTTSDRRCRTSKRKSRRRSSCTRSPRRRR